MPLHPEKEPYASLHLHCLAHLHLSYQYKRASLSTALECCPLAQEGTLFPSALSLVVCRTACRGAPGTCCKVNSAMSSTPAFPDCSRCRRTVSSGALETGCYFYSCPVIKPCLLNVVVLQCNWRPSLAAQLGSPACDECNTSSGPAGSLSLSPSCLLVCYFSRHSGTRARALGVSRDLWFISVC